MTSIINNQINEKELYILQVLHNTCALIVIHMYVEMVGIR